MLDEIRKNSFLQKTTPFLLGIFFGVLLDRGGLTRYSTMINQFLFKDFTLFKIFLTAVITGNLGISFLSSKGIINKKIKPLRPSENIIGGLIFGLGFGLLGFCIANATASIGAGFIDGVFGVSGIFSVHGFSQMFSHTLRRKELSLKVRKELWRKYWD